MSAPVPARVQAPALDGYVRRLIALLSLATFFEGFDTMVTSLVLHRLGGEFGVESADLFAVQSILGIGAVCGFVPMRFADRVGRRPILLLSISGYTLLCLLTATATTLQEFAAYQFFARMFMVTELAIAYVMLSEEVPAERRGQLNGWMGAFASVGAIVPAMLFPLSNELGFGWRGLYVFGGSLGVLIPLYIGWIRETQAFLELPRRAWSNEFREWLELARAPHRRRFVAASIVWFSVDFWNACAMFSFPFYVQSERAWTPGDLALWMPLGGLLQFGGYVLAGRATDRFGRKPTLVVCLGTASLASLACYQLEAKEFVVASYFAMVAMGGMWSIAQTISAELFPTRLRATANGLTHNLIGRMGMVLGPAAVASFTLSLGSVGDTVALLCLANFVAIPLLIWLLPETRGARLSGSEEPRPAAGVA